MQPSPRRRLDSLGAPPSEERSRVLVGPQKDASAAAVVLLARGLCAERGAAAAAHLRVCDAFGAVHVERFSPVLQA